MMNFATKERDEVKHIQYAPSENTIIQVTAEKI